MDDNIKDTLKGMLWELETSRLEVILTPAPEPQHQGHLVRTVASTNPDWYIELCGRYETERGIKGGKVRCRSKYDTRIKRQHVIKILKTLISTGNSRSKYKEDLIELAERQSEYWEDFIRED